VSASSRTSASGESLRFDPRVYGVRLEVLFGGTERAETVVGVFVDNEDLVSGLTSIVGVNDAEGVYDLGVEKDLEDREGKDALAGVADDVPTVLAVLTSADFLAVATAADVADASVVFCERAVLLVSGRALGVLAPLSFAEDLFLEYFEPSAKVILPVAETGVGAALMALSAAEVVALSVDALTGVVSVLFDAIDVGDVADEIGADKVVVFGVEAGVSDGDAL
jgi:hypothetical protein